MTEQVDAVIIGAGAAGLMAAIWAGRSFPDQRILLVDGARKPGAKILVAGGGRCNVTHDVVTPADYAGSSPNAIRKVLRRFDVPETTRFFRDLGVELKREETGKLFPTTDRAETVLDALFSAVHYAGIGVRYPVRVERITRAGERFQVTAGRSTIVSTKVVLATGGRALPKSGSDGHGYVLAQSLGHTLTKHIHPALVPLIVPGDHFLRQLSGISAEAGVVVRSGTGRRLASFTAPLLCTHFGLSGPVILDASRHLIQARFDDPQANLSIDWLPDRDTEDLDRTLQQLGSKTMGGFLSSLLPDRLASALIQEAGVAPQTTGHTLSREDRHSLVRSLKTLVIPVQGDRGFTHAEVTAGGVPLEEVDLATMQSRRCPGLFLCGEILNVDGRIGGFNFQWAWASGFVAGSSLCL